MTTTAVLVPFRASDPIREDRWRFVRRSWADAGYLAVPCDDGGDPFSRGCSVNQAAAQIPADVYVIADADTVTPYDQVEEAIRLAVEAPGLVIAHDRWLRLTVWATKLFMDGDEKWRRHIDFTLENTVSSCVAISAESWANVGGFDPRFRAWGAEDVQLEVASAELNAPTRRVHGDTVHLWHPPEGNRPQENRDMLDDYLRARGDVAAMRALVERAHATVAA